MRKIGYFLIFFVYHSFSQENKTILKNFDDLSREGIIVNNGLIKKYDYLNGTHPYLELPEKSLKGYVFDLADNSYYLNFYYDLYRNELLILHQSSRETLIKIDSSTIQSFIVNNYTYTRSEKELCQHLYKGYNFSVFKKLRKNIISDPRDHYVLNTTYWLKIKNETFQLKKLKTLYQLLNLEDKQLKKILKKHKVSPNRKITALSNDILVEIDEAIIL